MALDAVVQLEISLEIRLPHLVGSCTFKTLMGRGSEACFLFNQVVPMEDVVESLGAGKVCVAGILHDLTQFNRADGWMLFSHLDDSGFHLRRSFSGDGVGSPAAVGQGFTLLEALQPLVTGGTADTILPTKRRLAPFLRQHTPYKFFSHLFYSPFFPSHTVLSFLFWYGSIVSKTVNHVLTQLVNYVTTLYNLSVPKRQLPPMVYWMVKGPNFQHFPIQHPAKFQFACMRT